MNFNFRILPVILAGLALITGGQLQAQSKYTINGYVKDQSNGEALIGATVYIRQAATGTVTNVYGFYSLTLDPGTYTVEFSYLGYQSIEQEVVLDKNIRIDLELPLVAAQLTEVVVEADRDRENNVQSVEMSTNKLDIATIKKIPAFLGETDVLKSIQLLPGVSTVGEGASGFNVRGGSVGQNLILLDEAPVYNSSHLLGFFSVFNPDAVKDTKLYKGAIPSRYGGRLASLLDVRMKDGNNKKYEVTGGIGTIFSRLAVEGPIVKEKGSFIVAGRRSYADILARPFVELLQDGGALNFYDLTLKANYTLNAKNRVYASGYFGRDNFMFDANQGFDWGNSTATLRWNHLFNDRMFANVSAVFSNYDYALAFGEDDLDKFKWSSNIQNYMVKPEVTYFINSDNELSFGGEFTKYIFEPANALGVSDGAAIDISLPEKNTIEAAVYIGNSQKINSAIAVEYGLRYSYFGLFGAGTLYTYDNSTPGESKEVIATETFGRGEKMQTYDNLEPRLALKVQMNQRSSVKASYNRMVQYLHLISNTTASNPLDVWTPSTNNIEPELADQFTVGYFRDFGSNQDYEASIETYYRDTQNQIDYIDGAEILLNENLEADLLIGSGRAYGVELFVKKNSGKLNGWVSYTVGRTELQVEGINRGQWYPTRFDQTHNLKIAAFYDINKRWSLSSDFVFITGTPTTFPTSRYVVQGIVVPHNTNDSRNNVRIPSYHRLDLSARMEGRQFKRNGKERKFKDYWVFSVYNLYARRNPFSIYFSQQDVRTQPGTPTTTQATQLSIIGTIVPSVSYNFKF